MEAKEFNRKVNPEVDQDRVVDFWDTYKKYGYIMFPQQKHIYEKLARSLTDQSILEVGCGIGIGSAILSGTCSSLLATDKLRSNIDLGQELYPWIDFAVVDINQKFPRFCVKEGIDFVVGIEVIEHISNPVTAIASMLKVCSRGVFLSTPNGYRQESPPSNPFHVAEYTIGEFYQIVAKAAELAKVAVNLHCLDWENFELVVPETKVTPLVYYILKV